MKILFLLLSKKNEVVKKCIPFSILLSVFFIFWMLSFNNFISLEWLAENRTELTNWISANDFLAYVIYVLFYFLIVSCSIPGGTVMTIAGGFLFGPILGASLSVVGATAGAVVAFLAVRIAFEPLSKKHLTTSVICKMRKGFKNHALGYMLFLRLIPVFPFFMVNLIPALLGVRLMIFTFSTFLGIIPGTLIYSYLGSGLKTIVTDWKNIDQNIIFTPLFLFPLLGLGLLALAPIMYEKWKGFQKFKA